MHTRGRADRRREPRGRIPLESLVTDAVTVDVSSREPGATGRDELEPLLGDLGWLGLGVVYLLWLRLKTSDKVAQFGSVPAEGGEAAPPPTAEALPT